MHSGLRQTLPHRRRRARCGKTTATSSRRWRASSTGWRNSAWARQIVELGTLRERSAPRTRIGGYGSLNFAASLEETAAALLGAGRSGPVGGDRRTRPRHLPPRDRTSCRASEKPCANLFPNATTCGIVTKGHLAEQLGKVERSGLRPYISGASEAMREKVPGLLRGHRRPARF
jgi:hypothetical protein